MACLSLALVFANTSFASEEQANDNDKTQIEANQEIKEEKITDIYVVENVNDTTVDVYRKSDNMDRFSIAKDKFKGLDVKANDEFEITTSNTMLETFPPSFREVYGVKKVEAADQVNKDNKNNYGEKIGQYLVKDFDDMSVTLCEKGNEANVYVAFRSYFAGMDLKKGKEFTIYSDNIILKSNPAQFGKIYKVVDSEANSVSDIYLVKEVKGDKVIVYAEYNKNNIFQIDKKYFDELKLENDLTEYAFSINTSAEVLPTIPAQFAKINKIEVNMPADGAVLSGQKLINEDKTEKKDEKQAKNKAVKAEKAVEKKEVKKEEKIEEKEISDIYVVEKINEEGVLVHKKSNKEDKYLVEKKYFGNLQIKEGNEYQIFTNDIILTSNPAQFGKIFKIEEAKNKVASRNPKTGLTSLGLTVFALASASFAFKKSKK